MGEDNDSPDTRNKGTKKNCIKGVEGIQVSKSKGRMPWHLRWVVQYIRSRKGVRSKRFDLRVCDAIITMNSCMAFVGGLAIIQDCGVLIHWVGKVAVLGQFVMDILYIV